MINLKKRRQILGLTLRDIAKQCKTAPTTVKQWEQKPDGINMEHLRKYSKILGINPMKIIDPDEQFGKHLSYNNDKPTFSMNLPTINETNQILMNLTPKRVYSVFMNARKQLNEQNQSKIDYNTLQSRNTVHDLHVNGEIHKDEVDMYPHLKTKLINFTGIVPQDYDYVFAVKDNELEPFMHEGQKVFMQRTNNFFSGSFVLVELNGKHFIKQFRSINGELYLYDLNNTKTVTKITPQTDIIILGVMQLSY